MLVFLFPGQGSQQRGMGGGLFDEVREYAELEPQVDTLLGYSLRTLCLEDPDRRLIKTQLLSQHSTLSMHFTITKRSRKV